MRDRIDLEDSAVSVIHGIRDVRQYGVTERCNGLLAKGFLRVF